MATWSEGNASTTILTHNYGHRITLLDHSDICRRLVTAFDRISMLGASHIRYNYDYILSYCYASKTLDMLKRKHASYTVGNINFKCIWQASEFKQCLDEELRDFNITDKSLMITQFGAHDLAFYSLQNIMGQRMMWFFDAVIRMCKTGARVVVVSTPPFPDHDHEMKRRYGIRNNQAIPAFNYLLWEKVKYLQVGQQFMDDVHWTLNHLVHIDK